MGKVLLNKVPFAEPKTTKRCSCCGQDLPLSCFYKGPKGGLVSKCKECYSKHQASYRAKKKQQAPWFIDY